jgi:hypothetical protein
VAYTSLAIILPGQSITLDKTGQVTNARHQTVNELISLLKHYNAGSRRGKDQISGDTIGELLTLIVRCFGGITGYLSYASFFSCSNNELSRKHSG